MRKILLGLVLLMLAGCGSTLEPESYKNDLAKTSGDVKIMYKDFRVINFIVPTTLKFFRPTDNPHWLKTAQKHCTSLKKNTYYIHMKKGPGLFEIERVDWGNQKTRDMKDVSTVLRFVCAKDKSDAFRVGKNDTSFQPYYNIWYIENRPNSSAYHRTTLYEFKREVPPEEIAENKASEEREKLLQIEKERKIAQQKINLLELSYGPQCSGTSLKKRFVQGTKEYENCLFAAEKEVINKQKELDNKLAKMTPIERRDYNCENAFKFRKGSDKFRDCVFKLYTTELELEKLELQKQVALANERVAKAQAEAAQSAQARAEAVAAAQIAAAEAQKSAARSQSLASSLSLMQLGSSMMSSPAPAPSSPGMDRMRTTCRNVGGFINCY
jgi:hypothetical protein